MKKIDEMFGAFRRSRHLHPIYELMPVFAPTTGQLCLFP
jgi:hypothetical protein